MILLVLFFFVVDKLFFLVVVFIIFKGLWRGEEVGKEVVFCEIFIVC